MTAEFQGELAADAEWSGRVRLSGDVVVPPGRRLRLAAGTELSFAERPAWSCAVFRAAPEGYPIEASNRARCDLVVLGSLEVEGGWDRPVLARGPWGGVVLLGGGAASIRGAVLGGAEECLIQAFDDSRVELEDARLLGSRVGVLAWGLSRVRARRCLLETETGVLAREGSRAELERVELRGARLGLHGQHWSLLRAERCLFQGCVEAGIAAYDNSSVLAEGCAFHGCGQGLLGASDSRVRAEGCSFWANRVGAQAIERGRLDLRGCEVSGSDEQGVKLSQRSRGRVRGCRLSGNRLAGVYSEDQSQGTLSGCELEDEAPFAVAQEGRLACPGGSR